MQDAKEEVRARLSIEDVIGEYVQLKRAGRNLKGLSPFTDERTPSFMVSPEKQIWHDFSSGKGGDIFSFVMLMEGMDFRQSLEHLARKAGVELAQFSGSNGHIAKRKERAREALELAAKYFQQVLLRTPSALEYVAKKRRLTRETVQRFAIGYAPDDGTALVRALQKRGVSQQALSDAGLTNRFGGDLYRGRMVVALSDGAGGVVGFTGRIIRDEPNAPKYLNTPQTLLFDKSRHIFGLFQAKEAIRTQDEAVIVEGNLDVVSSHQAGVTNVVATAGTAMTEQHLKTLSRLASRVKLAFDGDQAGINATERAIGLAQTVGVELDVVTLPDGAKDPDELIQAQGAEVWRAAIAAAVPAVEWVIQAYAKREDVTTAEGKRRFTTASLALIRRLNDAVEREHYLARLHDMTGASLAALEEKMTATKEAPVRLKRGVVTRQPATRQATDAGERLLGVALLAPTTRHWLSAIDQAMLPDASAQQLLAFLRQTDDIITEPIPQDLQKIEQYVKIVQLKSETRYANWTEQDFQHEMASVVKKIVTEHRDNKKQQLIEQLRQAEAQHDDAKAVELRQAINALLKEKM